MENCWFYVICTLFIKKNKKKRKQIILYMKKKHGWLGEFLFNEDNDTFALHLNQKKILKVLFPVKVVVNCTKYLKKLYPRL